MTKRVVFAGGVQVKALAKAYRLDIALDTDEEVYFIGAESIMRASARKVVAAADILVTDLTPDGTTVPQELIQVGTLPIAVPVVTADFIWPYAAGPHPLNAPFAGLPDGPFPAGFGDSMLDSLATEGLDEDEAVARYLALDVAQDAALDDRLETSLSALRSLDARTGFDLADFISANFRTQWLFASRDRPNLPLFKHIAGRLFGQMGVPVSRFAQLGETFLPDGAMPIHPGVLAHFGMASPSPDYRYPVLDEGTFSFEAYCRRYWNYDFNRLLYTAIAKATTNPSEAIPQLRLALERSPGSRAGQAALREAERLVSDQSMLSPLSLPAAETAAPPPSLPPPSLPSPSLSPTGPSAQPAEPAVRSDAQPEHKAAPPPPTYLAPSEPELTAEQPWEEAPLAGFAPASASSEPTAPFTRTDPGETDGENEGEPEPTTQPSLLRRPPDGLVPRAAFGSSLVRTPLPSPTIEGELEPEESTVSLRFTSLPVPDDAAPLRDDGGMLVPLTVFAEVPEGATALVELPDGVPEPEPQAYVELPLGEIGDPPPLLPGKSVTSGERYTPLAPAEHLIPLLPRMLPNTRGMAGTVDKAFIDMPEIMPPPPLRPVLPPELHPEPIKTSLMAKLLDQLRR